MPVDLFQQSGIKAASPEEKALAQKVFMPDGAPSPTASQSPQPRDLFADMGIKLNSSPPEVKPTMKEYAEDVAKSAVYRGIPEGLAAATPLGLGLNIVRGVSDLTRWGAGKAYKGITGEALPHYAGENPIPTSHDVLNAAAKPFIGGDLYEPKTLPGQYAKTAAEFGSGGLATGTPLATSIPAAVASEAAGQATAGTDWEVPARIAGGLVGGAGANRVRDAINKPATPSASQVRAAASEKYKLADEQGGVILPDETNTWLDKSKSILPKSDRVRATIGETPSSKLVDGLESNFRGNPMTLREAQDLDSAIGDMMAKEVDLKTGVLTSEGKRLQEIQQHLRDTVEGAGTTGTDALAQGRQLWAAQARMNDVERIMARAEMTDNPVTAIKTGFRTMASNPARLRGFTAEEVKAINHAAKTGLLTGTLRTLGSRLMSGVTGATAGAAGGGPLGAVGGFIAGEAAAFPLRKMADALQNKRANSVLEKIASRPSVQNAMGVAPQQNSSAALIQMLQNKQLDLSSMQANPFLARALQNSPQ